MKKPAPNQQPNALIHETSPYLLQHAYNPVNWLPWSEEAFAQAQRENKPVLVSIGYSSCHWCHVMERESFEDEQIAQVMNQELVCIKVDREERPDVDQIYMDAMHAMGQQGGWPLNVFLLPNKQPFYGGTYFPAGRWVSVVKRIGEVMRTERKQAEENAQQLTNHLQQSLLDRLEPQTQLPTLETLTALTNQFSRQFDHAEGGLQRAPKFPMPSVYQYLLRQHTATGHSAAGHHVAFTLEKMLLGGIYDQAGGGFARYSVDAMWFAPHFEKMLYDNGQLLELMAQTYALNHSDFLLKKINQTAAFLQRELTDETGALYAALDADSEGIEGRFYVFTQAELDALDLPQVALFEEYYKIKPQGNWEHGYNILHAVDLPHKFAHDHNMPLADFENLLDAWHNTIMQTRSQRVRPGLDDKIITGWNGLALAGLTTAARHTGNQTIAQQAEAVACFLSQKVTQPNGQLSRTYKNGQLRHHGVLEDYAAAAYGMWAHYQTTQQQQWLVQAKLYVEYAIEHFSHPDGVMFYYAPDTATDLMVRRTEIPDNVIPSGNSLMARNLHYLGLLLGLPHWTQRAQKMLLAATALLQHDPGFAANWGVLAFELAQGTAEVAIIGPKAKQFVQQLHQHCLPNMLLCAANQPTKLPLHHNRKPNNNQTTIWLCKNYTCQQPVHSVAELLQQLNTINK